MSSGDLVLEELILRERIERERVAPKLEVFREPARIKGAVGGRAAGAKSWSLLSLAVQRANYYRTHIAVLREVQLTLEESVWKLFGQTIERLGYSGWDINKVSIDNAIGSHVIFRGLSDITAANIKSLEGFDIFLLEEAQSISNRSLDILFPTMRKPWSELWFAMNRDTDNDPILARTVGRSDARIVFLEPGPKDNPWWTAELQKEMEEDFKRDPELAEHIWNGAPRVQGERAIIARADVRDAMNRVLPETTSSSKELGIDVARFGDDRSVIYSRRGMKADLEKVFTKTDTQVVALTAWDLVDRNPNAAIKVDDDGVGGGVTDKLRHLGSKNTIAVHNGGKPDNDTLYTTCADEQWFTLPIKNMQIPNDPELADELCNRRYRYTSDDRKKIESKEEYKKRCGRSPDKADALLLAFYERKKVYWGVV